MWKRILSLLLVISTLWVGTPVWVYADETNDYKTFSQLDPRWRDYEYGGGSTIGSAGCFITSFAVVMAYANPELRDVETFNPQVLASKMSFTGNMLYAGSVTNADSTFHWESREEISGEEAVESRIKELLEDGKYVIVRAGPPIASRTTHFSPIVGWNEEADEPKIMDVAGGSHPEWSQWAPHVDRIDICSSDTLDSTESLTGSENTSDDIQENAPQTEEERTELESIINEYELEGMDGLAMTFEQYQEEVLLPSREGLNYGELQGIANINMAMKTDDVRISETLNRGIFIIGLFLVMYAILMLLALLLDWANVFIDVSLLGLITLGKYRLVSKDYFEENKLIGYDKKLKKTNVTPVTCIVRIVVLVVIGMLMMSGIAQNGILAVINWISSR